MEKKAEKYVFTGMQKDISVSKHPIQFIYEGLNIRMTARDGNSLLSITNEKGTKDTNISLSGKCVGYCTLNKYLVVFTDENHTKCGAINRINLETLENKVLFDSAKGNLNLSVYFPIDAIPSYENENIQKVYWTDYRNQPRVINIVADNNTVSKYTADYFDFIPKLQLKETVRVTKSFGYGVFAPGVIQYAFTYYRKYGQESAIFYTTPLYYIAHRDRGASPEDKVACSFTIKINNIDNNFDYLRIYSIQRTSINGTPVCKRVQDLDISLMSTGINGIYTSFTDTGASGNTVDPTELLYKDGWMIKAKSITSKDNTLFLGNINIDVNGINKEYSLAIGSMLAGSLEPTYRNISTKEITGGSYSYSNYLSSYNIGETNLVPCSGFKKGNTYRLGIQFQHETGKWSNPIHIKDEPMTLRFSSNEVPVFQCTLNQDIINRIPSGYKKARAVVVFPSVNERTVICQGIVNPTLYTDTKRNNNTLYSQASWFFRPAIKDIGTLGDVVHPPVGNAPENNNTVLLYSRGSELIAADDTDMNKAESIEIQGRFNTSNKFKVDNSFITLHSPDLELDDYLMNVELDKTLVKIGNAKCTSTFSDISIQTESAPFNASGGPNYRVSAYNSGQSKGIGSGFFYKDALITDASEDKLETATYGSGIKYTSCDYLVYAWQGNGSLNNDFKRPESLGAQTAVLRKKIISNLRYTNTEFYAANSEKKYELGSMPELFSSNEVSIIKIGGNIYQGNIDTLLNPDNADGSYFSKFLKDVHKTHSNDESTSKEAGVYKWETDWVKQSDTTIGNYYVELVVKRNPVRMKYKSTPHIVVNCGQVVNGDSEHSFAIAELRRNIDKTLLFGGTTEDALCENNWIPCGDPVEIYNGSIVEFSWGDTYFQRYDCLKTYPFTQDDPNQIVEIGSFMLETYVNIDGRYDRNRGQISNLNMSPTNFNLINPVYSQQNNFFSYKILPDDYYKNTKFANQITWTKEKQTGADIDLCTNITMASTYDVDGSKGEITSLNYWKDGIYCFQNKGVSNILFNSRVQIPVSDGVPIEITNSYKVDGYRYIADGVGCNDSRLIKETKNGIYFIDSINSHLFRINDGFEDIASSLNMTSWFKENKKDIKTVLYDNINSDVYVVQKTGKTALCFSEKLGQFTGEYNYDNIDLIETYNHRVFTLKENSPYSNLYSMFEGEYGKFFGVNKPWYLIFVSNGTGNDSSILDKTFTNLEFRACVEEEVMLPFDYVETWNEYQHGIGKLSARNGYEGALHHETNNNSGLKRKFRIWRCDIPRDNADLSEDSLLKITRTVRHPLDRMRNPWLYIKLCKNAAIEDMSLAMTEIHDIMSIYFC